MEKSSYTSDNIPMTICGKHTPNDSVLEFVLYNGISIDQHYYIDTNGSLSQRVRLSIYTDDGDWKKDIIELHDPTVEDLTKAIFEAPIKAQQAT